MAKKDLLAASREAAAKTWARILKDRERAPWQVAAFLGSLCRDDHLFAEGLEVGHVLRACRIPKGGFSSAFRRHVGYLPSEYLRHRRLEVAARLLRDTDFKIGLIGETVGYPLANWFSRAFRQWAGESPRRYRKRHKAGAGLPIPVHDPLFSERAFAGELDREPAELYILYLRELYGLPPGEQAPIATVDAAFHDEAMAEAVWRRIRELPAEEQEQVVRRHYGFRTPALFELLVEKSREAGRSDSRRRLRLAELARASLDALDPTPGSDLLDVKVRAWAYLAHARRLVFDLAGSEQALARAEVTWQVPRDRRDPRALADVYAAKAMLRYFQRRFERALYWNGKAVALLRELGTRAPLVNALLARAAIRGASGQAGAAAVADLREAFETLEELERPELRLSVFASLAATHALAGEYAEAARLLPRAQRLARSLRHHVARAHLRWVEGLIRKGQGDLPAAERLLRAARQQLAELENHDHSALVALELALLCAEAGRRTEALRWVAETIPFFEAFRIRREALAALRLIHEARDREALPLAILRQIRAAIGKLRNDPYFGQPVKIGDAPG